MRKKLWAAAGVIGLVILAGCSNTGSSETEELKKQVAQLEQQVTDLKSQNTQAGDEASSAGQEAQTDGADDKTDAAGTESGVSAGTESGASAAAEVSANGAGTAAATMEELSAKVDAFVEKAGEAKADKTDQENLDTFFALKQEEKAINDELDLYEDELERQYRAGELTRDEYRAEERELELLEDKLDEAEDALEYVFGIDD